eukprot:scpid90840/ scgid9821/ 
MSHSEDGPLGAGDRHWLAQATVHTSPGRSHGISSGDCGLDGVQHGVAVAPVLLHCWRLQCTKNRFLRQGRSCTSRLTLGPECRAELCWRIQLLRMMYSCGVGDL